MVTVEVNGKEYSGDALWREEEVLRELYIERNKTQAEVAGILDCGSSTVGHWLDKQGVQRERQTKPWHDKSTLEELYVEKRRTLAEVGETLGCTASTVRNWLNRHDIETRDVDEAVALERRRTPAYFRTGQRGYEAWEHTYQGEKYHVYVHRLLAVAKYGFDAVKGKHVHHKLGIKWANWEDAIEVMEGPEHRSMHFTEVWESEEHREMMRQVGRENEAEMPRDENGNFLPKED